MSKPKIDRSVLGEPLIIVCGPVGANKHEIADELHNYVGRPEYRFSEYLKSLWPPNAPDKPSQQDLQDIGSEVIRQKPWSAFCHEVLGVKGRVKETQQSARQTQHVPPPLRARELRVVDGARHVFAIRYLRQLAAPADALVVFVEATREEQVETLRRRGNNDAAIRSILRHPVEAETGLVSMMADFRISKREDVGTVVGDLAAILEKGEDRYLALLQSKTGLAKEQLLDWRINSAERYETLKEVVKLVGAIASDESVRNWLRTPQAAIGRQTPWETIESGDRDRAIEAAIETIETP
ncbi:MAG TPA: hypothetical protein VME66_05725 [Candidatus Acidoferrales bacterium]|nr:hypothetical protein [Candidatus Acidoferrales bacterium]